MLSREVTAILKSRSTELKGLGAISLYAFGSRNRGDFHNDSDLDLFIDYDVKQKTPSFFKLIEAELNLQEELGFPVHITTRSALHPKMREAILSEATQVF